MNKQKIIELLQTKPFIKGYWSGAMCFDIETSSFYYKGKKAACMYLWAFAIDDYAFTGRTWDEFRELIDFLDSIADDKHKFCIFVHNLSYEFQWICKKFHWHHVFALSKREVARAETGSIVFKCSYLLSGLSLEKTAEQYNKVHKKLTSIADYESIRTPESVLTEEDYMYVKEDVLSVTEYINKQIERYGSVEDIPLTCTGAVRKELRKHLFPKGKRNNEYARLMKNLTLDIDEYMQLKKAYCGGFTHANYHYADRVIDDVVSMDFTSSYPTVMLLDYMPMSKGINVVFNYKYLETHCCMFTIHAKNVVAKFDSDHLISFSKCEVDWDRLDEQEKKDERGEEVTDRYYFDIDNGRVMEASEIVTTMTELDFDLFRKCYDYDEITFTDCWIYERGYLPKEFMEFILFLYKQKTELKGVEGQEVIYNLYKAMLNSLYGCLVTDDIGRPEQNFEAGEWKDPTPANIKTNVDHYNSSKNRFSFYPWGVWVTAHARHNLWTGILECGDDYLYSDTDSLKVRNFKDHEKYFDDYNEGIKTKIKKICELYDFKEEDFQPKTIEGESKLIGIWDFDGHYNRFKTLGSKRYLVEYSDDPRNKKNKNKIACTIAGLPKDAVKNFTDKPFEFFTNKMYLDEESSLKSSVTYSDEGCEGVIKDKNGKKCKFKEDSFVHIEKTTFMLGLAVEYYNLLMTERFKVGATC